MSQVALGVLCGAVFGAVAVALMLPMSFPDKRAALTAAFLNRFGIGLLIAVADLGLPGWLSGLAISLLLSAPAAIVTRAYAPILGIGAVGGLLIGWIAGGHPIS
ncbi:MAG TPA: hypothetical protein VGQ69_11845 [Gemmatimonadales bacterium]|jgi:hypothetical protein|nr:hypothetical protein [Gemmatimonadales bacterium]